MGQKFINPIYEPEKLVVGGLYRVVHVHEDGVEYVFQKNNGAYGIDYFLVGDYFVPLNSKNKIWFSRKNAPGYTSLHIYKSKWIRSYLLDLGAFQVIQIVDGDEQETPP